MEPNKSAVLGKAKPRKAGGLATIPPPTPGSFTVRKRYTTPFVCPTSGPYYSNAEFVYSYRSRISKTDKVPQGTVIGGISAPNPKGSIEDIVRDRTRFYEEMQQVSREIPAYSPQGRVSATDLGHNFASVKYHSYSHAVLHDTWLDTGVDHPCHLQAYGTSVAMPGYPRPVSEFPYQIDTKMGLPNSSTLRARLNSVFSSIDPTRHQAGVGETIVSLMKGELPRYFLELHKTLARVQRKSLLKSAGADYLGVNFAWKPLVKDIESTIKILLTVDHLVYGESFRRERAIPLVNDVFWSSPQSLQMNTAYHNESYGTSSTSAVSALGPSVETKVFYDLRLSTRIVVGARPGIGANNFIAQAEDKLQQLGAWYPSLGWDLLPYSWLLDWFFHLGSAIDEMYYKSRDPGLVKSDYAWATACLRVNSKVDFVLRQRNVGFHAYKVVGTPMDSSIVKWRFGASPYGFGVDLTGLSASQYAILVALGLAKRG